MSWSEPAPLDCATAGDPAIEWPRQIFDALKAARIRQVCHVPDGGHGRLIGLCTADPELVTTTLTTEEEGIGVLAGAWLGGERGVLLMQSSGVGNCINMLSMVRTAAFPFLAIVSMGRVRPLADPDGAGGAGGTSGAGGDHSAGRSGRRCRRDHSELHQTGV